MKDTAVIILNWNGADMMRRFLPEVVRSTPAEEADVIVADNGSTDNSLQVLAEEFPSVKVIVLDKNYGFAEGYNRALASVEHEYAVLLNSDVATSDGWLDALKAEMRDNADVAACQPKILSAERRNMFEYAGACGGYLDRNGYFAHMEEIDLCWRLRLRGFRVRVVPASKVYHLGGGSLPAGNPRKTYLNFRNNLLMLYKNLPHKGRRKALIVRRLLDTIAWAKSVATLQWGDAGAILRAHRDFRRMKRAYDGLPSPTANLISGEPDILTSYYLKGKKEYSRL